MSSQRCQSICSQRRVGRAHGKMEIRMCRIGHPLGVSRTHVLALVICQIPIRQCEIEPTAPVTMPSMLFQLLLFANQLIGPQMDTQSPVLLPRKWVLQHRRHHVPTYPSATQSMDRQCNDGARKYWCHVLCETQVFRVGYCFTMAGAVQ